MSEGIFLFDPRVETIFSSLDSLDLPESEGIWNYTGKIKFFVRVTEKPANDMDFALTASLWQEEGTIRRQKMSVYANNRPIEEWVWDRHGREEKTIVIPLEMLEESYDDPMNLLTLVFYLSDAETTEASPFSLMFEKMEFRERVF